MLSEDYRRRARFMIRATLKIVDGTEDPEKKALILKKAKMHLSMFHHLEKCNQEENLKNKNWKEEGF